MKKKLDYFLIEIPILFLIIRELQVMLETFESNQQREAIFSFLMMIMNLTLITLKKFLSFTKRQQKNIRKKFLSLQLWCGEIAILSKTNDFQIIATS